MMLGCAAASLTACGGGGGGGGNSPGASVPTTTSSPPAQATSATNSTAAPVTSTTAAAPWHIILSCDSTCWGVDVDYTDNVQQAPGVGAGTVGRAHVTPAQLMQADLDNHYGPGVWYVDDQSTPGARFITDVNGTPPNVSSLASRLAAVTVPPSHVLVATNYEINDQYVDKDTTSTIRTNATLWVQTVKSYGMTPIYLEPNPIARSDQNYSDPTTGTNALVAVVDSVFAEYGGYVATNLPQWENYTSPPNPAAWNSIWLSSDGVHPNDAGYVQKEKNYWPTILKATQDLMAQ